MIDLFPAVVWLLFSLLAFALLLSGIRTRKWILRRWVRVSAAVVRCEVVAPRFGLARPVITYEYDSDNYHFLGQYCPWGIGWGLRRTAEATAERFVPGFVFPVFVHPDNHQASLVLPWPSLWLCVVLLAFCLVAFVLGVSAAIPIFRISVVPL